MEGAHLRHYRFPLIPFDRIAAHTQGRYLVKTLIPAEAMIVVWGPPKCGKSFWTFDVAMHIATERPDYRGLKVRAGAVVYIAAEGGSGFLGRVQAWRDKHLSEEASGVPFYLLPMRLDLYEDQKELIADLTDQLPLKTETVLVVIDTLNRTFTGSESSDEDMTKYVKAADAIKAHFRCSVAIVHHCGHETTRPRGHTSLTGAADCQIKITKDKETGLVTAEVEWMKDGPEGYKNHSRLEVVNIGKDEDGDDVTTCVIDPADSDPAVIAQNGEKRKKLGANDQIAVTSLGVTLAEQGKEAPPSNHIPSHARVVTVDAWRQQFMIRFADDKLNNNGSTKRTAFMRSLKSLQVRGVIGHYNDMVWLIQKKPRFASQVSQASQVEDVTLGEA